MKAEGIEYEERMALLEEVTYPKPLEEPLSRRSGCTARRTRGCPTTTSRPSRSCATCTRTAARSPSSSPTTASRAPRALVLRYLSDTYRALRQTVPERVKTDELDDIIEWLGETGPPGRLQPARRVGGADRPGVRRSAPPRPSPRRSARPAAPDQRQRACVPRDGPQRDVPEGAARVARPYSDLAALEAASARR